MGKGLNAIKWSTIDAVLLNFFSLGVFFILAYQLNVESFGFVNLASFFILLLNMAITFGFNVAIIQKKDVTKLELSTAFYLILFLAVFTALSIFLLSDFIGKIFNQPQLAEILKPMSIIPVFKGLSVLPECLLQKEMKFKSLAIRNITATLSSGSVALILAFHDYGYWSLVWQQITLPFMGMIMLWSFNRWAPSFQFQLKSVRKLFEYAKFIFLNELVSIYNRQGLRLFIGYFLGPTALGYYSLANRLFLLVMNIITVSLTKVTLPYFSKMQDDVDNVRSAFYKITSLASVIIFPVLCFMIVFLVFKLFIEAIASLNLNTADL